MTSEHDAFNYVARYAAGPAVNLSDHTLIFTHMPKAAGTTLDNILYATAGIQGIPYLRALGTIYDQFHGFGKGEARQDFARWPESALQQRAYISGHLPYGVHKRLARPYFYVTMLRSPTSRLLSQFLYGVKQGGWSIDTPLADIFEQGYMADNVQTRLLAGLPDRTIPCTAEVFRNAIEHLKQDYTVIGISEKFDATLRLLITLLDWPDIAFGRKQVSEIRGNESVMEQAQALTDRYFAYDVELYAVGSQLASQAAEKLLTPVSESSKVHDSVLVCIAPEEHGYRLVSKQQFGSESRPQEVKSSKT